MMSSYDLFSYKNFQKKYNKLKAKQYVFRYNKDGKIWYILVMGDYTTLSAAKAAYLRLPLSIKKPWIITFAGVQDVVEAFQTKQEVPTSKHKIMSADELALLNMNHNNTNRTLLAAEQETDYRYGSKMPIHHKAQSLGGTKSRTINFGVTRLHV